MLGQAVAFILALALVRHPLVAGITSAVTLGVGTAMVYPALIAAVGDHAHPPGGPKPSAPTRSGAMSVTPPVP